MDARVPARRLRRQFDGGEVRARRGRTLLRAALAFEAECSTEPRPPRRSAARAGDEIAAAEMIWSALPASCKSDPKAEAISIVLAQAAR